MYMYVLLARLQWLFDIQYLFAVLRLPTAGTTQEQGQADER